MRRINAGNVVAGKDGKIPWISVPMYWCPKLDVNQVAQSVTLRIHLKQQENQSFNFC